MSRKPSARPQGGGKFATVTRYRTVKCPGHPLAQADGKVYAHRLILYRKVGPGPQKCHWCCCRIVWFGRGKRIATDHLDSDRWNNRPSNLVPSCFYCNHRRAHDPDFLTHCRAGHEYTKETVYLRVHRASGRKTRVCLTCKRIRESEFRRKRRLLETSV